MKVTKVTCHLLQSKVDRPFTSARGWLYATRSSCVVEVETDAGVTGWGERQGPAAGARAPTSQAQHAAMRDAIAARGAERAAALMGQHLQGVESYWRELLQRRADRA